MTLLTEIGVIGSGSLVRDISGIGLRGIGRIVLAGALLRRGIILRLSLLLEVRIIGSRPLAGHIGIILGRVARRRALLLGEGGRSAD